MSRLFCICFFGTKIYPIFARMSKNENIMNKVLIIDDEPQIRQLLARILGLEGYEVLQAGDCKAAVKQMEYSPNVILCDVFLPDGNGVDFIKTIKKISPESEIILLTAHGNIPDGVQAIKNGAFDYITKGDDNNKIIPLISRAMEKARTNGVKNRPEKETFQQYSFNSILGQSKPLLEAIALARKVASTDVPVLLTGETGTGKEVFAQAIHHESKRNKGNFVAINCSAFSKELLESEIFGHKAGSFTGALKDKKGLFEEAHNGTIFLDEIGEMAIELQAKLLRVLETGEYHFREDLFYRLSVFQIHLPPLRERPGDIRLLTEAFVQSLSEKMTHSSKTVSKAFIDMLEQQEWKGNVRELRNVIERSLIVCESDELHPEDLPIEIQNAAFKEKSCNNSGFELSAMEKRHIARVLDYTNGNKTETAKLLKIELTTLYRKIEEYKL